MMVLVEYKLVRFDDLPSYTKYSTLKISHLSYIAIRHKPELNFI